MTPLSRRRSLALLGSAALLSMTRARARAAALPRPAIVLGDDVFLQSTWRELGGRGVGIVTNQTGITGTGESIVDAVQRNTAIKLRALFSPEHGLRGDQTAGAYVASYTDKRSGLPVYSLYGATRHPSPQMLEGIDVLLFDIQDVGSRAYTYISTMAYVMQTAAELGKEVWILDRPNPVGGEIVEGPVLDPRFRSFVGLYPIAMRHAMTVGELARMFNDRFGIGAKLRVIPMQGWRRAMFWNETGLPWVQSSPNIPTWETCLVYPATGLIDEAGINNGTNYSKPFFYAGIPPMASPLVFDAQRYADELNARPIPGIHFRPAAWTPFGGFWAGKTLTGVELEVFDPRVFPSVRTAVELIVTVWQTDRRFLRFSKAEIFDRDWGTNTVRNAIAAGASADEIVNGWSAGTRAFVSARNKYLLYS